ncbi:hypothetical protein Sste5346_008924 [Sporothrix stenoceras]|uniref:Tse2 ADP-ribosyltransferase toxin domain-containing protein n=1 Tax=Sporothrix stenoceras TaxID=5173 RepID=A0ABR3YNJ8_9PEZI
MRPNLIAVYRVLPLELFRINNGPIISLRDKANVQTRPGQRAIYDIASHDGNVFPKALDAETYRAPNGASMRPNSPYQQQLVRSIFHGNNRIVYAR